ncbi:MAG: hypothetical protein COY40_00575 [Alphaproteobacteria bacterium CG_4_10_14_0_8_um_filter_53_9]|nr:MAG: hypothetical protein COY40_00575 [Alphaproteobacteria bacterium CG_4_10_14_0_8_um_filter_53_9]
MEGIVGFVTALWTGKAPLWVAFWVYGQGIYALIMAAYFTMYKFGFEILAPVQAKLAGADVLGKVVQGGAAVVNVVDAVAFGLFTLLWFVAIWRCAPNTDYVMATYAARGFVVLVGAVLLCGAWIWVKG